MNKQQNSFIACILHLQGMAALYGDLSEVEKESIIAVAKTLLPSFYSLHQENSTIQREENGKPKIYEGEVDVEDEGDLKKIAKSSKRKRARSMAPALKSNEFQIGLVRNHIAKGKCCYINGQFFFRCNKMGVRVDDDNHDHVKRFRNRAAELDLNFGYLQYCQQHVDSLHLRLYEDPPAVVHQAPVPIHPTRSLDNITSGRSTSEWTGLQGSYIRGVDQYLSDNPFSE